VNSGRQLAAVAMLVSMLSALAGGAVAQSANMSVSASVFQAITVSGTQTLAFGNVFPGVNKTIPATAGASNGRFVVTGQANANISLSFTLPANLVNGVNLLPVGSWTGRHNDVNNAGSGTSITPSSTAVNTTLSGAGERYIFIGGTVSPAANQAAGFYTATATLTVAYF